MKDFLNKISVDIILPNYNSAPYVSETINSIVNQTFRNWKLIIVDGNSNIETQKILQSCVKHPNINVIWLKKNKRAGFCRNLAIRNSKSEYIAFIDSDDIWDNEKLYKQLDFMIKNKYYFTYTNYLPFRTGKNKIILEKLSPQNILLLKNLLEILRFLQAQ